ncbi:MAG TPA: PKD domain-containing protein, partial [Gammaproteobacteria bacterium]|nr:PKD domain-containing protein [Gammaproteobacteria bacterium]
MNDHKRFPPGSSLKLRWPVALLFSLSSLPALAFNSYLTDFNTNYNSQGTRIDSCGQCHYDFNGGGLRTPYGEDYRNNNYAAANIGQLDSDGDGFTNDQEAAAGTLTFPGLSCTNLASALNAPADIANYVDPSNPGCIGPGQSPVANPNGPYVAVNGQPLTFSSAGSFDPDGTITSYLWDFGGGFGTSTQPNPVFTYNLSFQAKIIASLTVTDNDGNTTTATTTVNLLRTANSPPTADAGAAVTGTVNSPVIFNGNGSSDPEGARLSYRWDFADGSIGTRATPSHSYTRCGTYTVGLTVTDDVGLSAGATTTATISSSGIDAPVANAGGGATGHYDGAVGSNIQFDGSSSVDPDCNITSYNWDFGDGSSGLGISPVHSYAIAGDYVVTLTVTDNDGLTGIATATVTVVDAGVLDGAALYDANCGACHGMGTASTKAGADVNRINAGIANVGSMNSLATTLSAAEIQAIADFLVALSPPPPPPPPPAGATGAELYDANCGACHGMGTASTKAGADVNRINAGIANVASMNS